MPEPAYDTTPLYGFRFPVDEHSADGPEAFEFLATDIENWLSSNVPYHGVQQTVPAEQSNGAGFAELGTPDRVTLDVPDDSLVLVTYAAEMYVDGNPGGIALYIDDVQVKATTGSTDLPLSSYAKIGTADLFTSGDVSTQTRAQTADGFVYKIGGTGQHGGSVRFGPLVIPDLDAGAHVFSVRFAVATAKNRQLRVWAQPFDET